MTPVHPAAGSTGDPAEPVRPGDHAEAAAEAVRALNHATLRHGDPAGYEWPSDVDAVIGQLQLLAERLPQALQQAQGWLLDQLLAGRVGHDTPGRKAGFAVGIAAGYLDEAATATASLAHALGQARRESSHLTGVTNPIDAADGGGL